VVGKGWGFHIAAFARKRETEIGLTSKIRPF